MLQWIRNRNVPFLFVLFVLVFSGCATPVKPDRMIPHRIYQSTSKTGPLYKNISINDVGGGKKTNPLIYPEVGSNELKEALKISLARHQFYAAENKPEYFLKAFLVEIKRPMSGWTMTMTAFIRYTLTRARDNEVILDEIISSSSTKSMKDTLSGTKRFKITQEEVMQKNIALLLERLEEINSKG